MLVYKKVLLKDGTECVIRSMVSSDAEAVLNLMHKTAAETDYLLRYPEEISWSVEEEASFIDLMAESRTNLLIGAEVNGTIAATASINMIGEAKKLQHRGELGIAVLKEFYRKGIASALMETLLKKAKGIGYRYIELEVVEENDAAVSLYRKFGFEEFGRNPGMFLLNDGRELGALYMRKVL